jgi:DNA-binding NtrC family response regulator
MIDVVLDRFMRSAIETALTVSRGNVQAAAECLGIERTCLFARMKRLGVDVEKYREKREASPPLHKKSSSTQMSAVYLNGIQMVIDALAAENGNRTRAASRLGICLRTVRYKIAEAKKLGFVVVEPESKYHWRRKK